MYDMYGNVRVLKRGFDYEPISNHAFLCPFCGEGFEVDRTDLYEKELTPEIEYVYGEDNKRKGFIITRKWALSCECPNCEFEVRDEVTMSGEVCDKLGIRNLYMD